MTATLPLPVALAGFLPEPGPEGDTLGRSSLFDAFAHDALYDWLCDQTLAQGPGPAGRATDEVPRASWLARIVASEPCPGSAVFRAAHDLLPQSALDDLDDAQRAWFAAACLGPVGAHPWRGLPTETREETISRASAITASHRPLRWWNWWRLVTGLRSQPFSRGHHLAGLVSLLGCSLADVQAVTGRRRARGLGYVLAGRRSGGAS